MAIKSKLTLVLKAAALSVLMVGTMASGLTLTTYAMAKANALVFNVSLAAPVEARSGYEQCLQAQSGEQPGTA